MSDKTQPLPPIANALRIMSVDLAGYYDPLSSKYVGALPGGMLERQALHAKALIDNVAAIERSYAEVTVQLENMRPHQDFLALTREIHVERRLQDDQWGGPAHDDTHAPTDWFDLITRQIERAAATVDGPADVAALRLRLVKIAALAVAGVQSIDRRAAPVAGEAAHG